MRGDSTLNLNYRQIEPKRILLMESDQMLCTHTNELCINYRPERGHFTRIFGVVHRGHSIRNITYLRKLVNEKQKKNRKINSSS